MSELVPVQNEKPKSVERWIAELAYLDYAQRFPGQTLDTLLIRGGFGQNELIEHVARVAREALDQIDQFRYRDAMRHAEIVHRRAEVERLQAELATADLTISAMRAGYKRDDEIYAAVGRLYEAFNSVRGDYIGALEELLAAWNGMLG